MEKNWKNLYWMEWEKRKEIRWKQPPTSFPCPCHFWKLSLLSYRFSSVDCWWYFMKCDDGTSFLHALNAKYELVFPSFLLLFYRFIVYVFFLAVQVLFTKLHFLLNYLSELIVFMGWKRKYQNPQFPPMAHKIIHMRSHEVIPVTHTYDSTSK